MAAYLAFNIVIDRGVTQNFDFIWESGGDNVDLSSSMLRMEIRRKAGGDVLDVLTTENGRLVYDLESREFSIIFPADVSAAFDFKEAVFALDAKSQSGAVYPLIEGAVVVRQRAIQWPTS